MLALAPRRLAGRLAAWSAPGLPAVPWLSVLASLLAGIVTHLAWDAFTHEGYFRFVEARLPVGVYLHQVLQHASTLAGSAFLAWWGWRKLAATRPQPVAHELPRGMRIAVLAAMTVFPAIAFFGVLGFLEVDAETCAPRSARGNGHGNVRVRAGGARFLARLEGGALAPHFPRDFDHALELAPLLFLGEPVAVVGAREAALRRKAQVFQRHVARSFINAFFQ